MSDRKVALITGITGQDGSYLAELLLDKDYEVHGIIRRSSSFNTARIDHLYQDPHEKDRRLILHYGDLSDGSNISRIIEKVTPDEIYNLGAQSHVKVSFEVPEYTAEVDAIGTIRILDAIKDTRINTRFYQASTSELYGKAQETPQSETTPFYPRSPYGAAKLYAYWVTVNYREAYGIYACNGILFNHESERRGETFVSRKVPLEFKGQGQDRKGIDESGKIRIEIDPAYFRPTEVDLLLGDFSKAKQKLGWSPKVSFKDLVARMVEHDTKLAELATEPTSGTQTPRFPIRR